MYPPIYDPPYSTAMKNAIDTIEAAKKWSVHFAVTSSIPVLPEFPKSTGIAIDREPESADTDILTQIHETLEAILVKMDEDDENDVQPDDRPIGFNGHQNNTLD